MSRQYAQEKLVYTKKRFWKGHHCCVPYCWNSSKDKKKQDQLGNVSYHSFPDVKSTRGKQWINRIRRSPGTAFDVNSRTKICSEHFVPADFISSDLPVEDKR